MAIYRNDDMVIYRSGELISPEACLRAMQRLEAQLPRWRKRRNSIVIGYFIIATLVGVGSLLATRAL